ncbi:MAG: acetoin utilization protein AcuC [Deltaproteobacteria bacterium]|nr:acetoin utilization protein AcuC [Deltaproteobacteria bacterium]
MKQVIVYNPEVESYTFGPEHPFRLDRGRLFLDKARKHGLLADGQLLDAPPAGDNALLSFHSPEYVAALRKADEGDPGAQFLDFGLGPMDNPVFPGLYRLSTLFAGTALTACDLVCEGGADTAFVPVGGFHHARRGRAGGFCYVSDLGIAMEQLLWRGLRLLYVDIDAHHGDGVQDAFYDNRQVLKISFHETGRELFPFSGFESELGSRLGEGYNVNVPLDPLADDEVFLFLFKKIFPPLAARFDPDVTIAQIGVDMHNTDPLTHLRLTNNGYAEAVRIIVQWSKKLIAFGGGGYNPDNIAKGYALAWALMNGRDPFTDGAGATLGGTFVGSSELDGLGSLLDMPLRISGPEKETAAQEAYRVHEYIRRNVFHRLGI